MTEELEGCLIVLTSFAFLLFSAAACLAWFIILPTVGLLWMIGALT